MEGKQPALEQRDGRHRRSLVGALRVVAAARPRRTAIRPFAGAFERLDTDFVRVLEVAIEALTARSVIRIGVRARRRYSPGIRRFLCLANKNQNAVPASAPLAAPSAT